MINSAMARTPKTDNHISLEERLFYATKAELDAK